MSATGFHELEEAPPATVATFGREGEAWTLYRRIPVVWGGSEQRTLLIYRSPDGVGGDASPVRVSFTLLLETYESGRAK